MGDQYLWFVFLGFAAVMALAGALVYVLLRGRGTKGSRRTVRNA